MSKFPVIEVGDPVTADMLNSMIPDITYKSTATSRANNTMADDPDLVTPVLLANATYLVEFSIRYAAITAAGFRTAWTMPAGVISTNKEAIGPGSSAADTGADNISTRSGVHAYTSTIITYGTRNNATNQLRAYEASTVIMGGTAGAVSLQWAQVTTNATGSTLSAGSYVKVTRTA